MSVFVGELEAELPPVLRDGVLGEIGGHGVPVALVEEVVDAGGGFQALTIFWLNKVALTSQTGPTLFPLTV